MFHALDLHLPPAETGIRSAQEFNGVKLTTTAVIIPNGQDHVDIILNPASDSVVAPTETLNTTTLESLVCASVTH